MISKSKVENPEVLHPPKREVKGFLKGY
jgi:exodeoxyribonuclease III